MPPRNLKKLAADPVAFRAALLIDAADRSAQPLGETADPWQLGDFQAIDAALRPTVQQVAETAPTRVWLERPRGHSKTSDVAACVAWALFASKRPLKAIAAAADQDQAALVRDALERIVRLNQWLGEFLSVKAWKVTNEHTGSELEIITSDAVTSHGALPDLLFLDEVCHWPKRNLFDALLSAAAKRTRCAVLIGTNSGWVDSWAFGVREAIRVDPDWSFRRLEGPVASWISPKRLDEQRRLLPAAVFERLWLNVWSSGSGDAIDAADIEHAIDPACKQRIAAGESYVFGLDIGIKHDNSALVGVGKNESGGLRVAYLRAWRGGRLDFGELENEILEAFAHFRFSSLAVDPWQASHLVERLKKAGVPVVERPQSGPRLVEQAMAVVDAFRTRTIRLPAHQAELISELRRLRIEERSYGIRLVADRDASGHGDRATALSIALAECKGVESLPAFIYLLDQRIVEEKSAELMKKLIESKFGNMFPEY